MGNDVGNALNFSLVVIWKYSNAKIHQIILRICIFYCMQIIAQ